VTKKKTTHLSCFASNVPTIASQLTGHKHTAFHIPDKNKKDIILEHTFTCN